MTAFMASLDLHLNPEFGEQVKEAVKGGMEDGFRQMTRVAARLSPYRTGNNARLISWTSTWGKRGENTDVSGDEAEVPGELGGAIFTQSGYGAYLELGTSRMGARPYIRPAVEQEVNYMLGRIKARISAFKGE